ncbi:MAG: hypothetical protein NC223_00120 [Butyrivibrio sp.]|nr:hypothetical protein [Butyrivibrio sp.]
MFKIKAFALALLFAALISAAFTADGRIREQYGYYGFSVLFRQTRYVGRNEEVLKGDIGEPLGEAAQYQAFRDKSKGCDCLEVVERDTAKVYRDMGCEDYSSIIVLTDTGAYIRAYDASAVEFNQDISTPYSEEREVFLVKNTGKSSWSIYGASPHKKQGAEQCEKLLRLAEPFANQMNSEALSPYLAIKISPETDSVLKITLYYSDGGLYAMALNMTKHTLLVDNEQFLLSEEEYREWADALPWNFSDI